LFHPTHQSVLVTVKGVFFWIFFLNTKKSVKKRNLGVTDWRKKRKGGPKNKKIGKQKKGNEKIEPYFTLLFITRHRDPPRKFLKKKKKKRRIFFKKYPFKKLIYNYYNCLVLRFKMVIFGFKKTPVGGPRTKYGAAQNSPTAWNPASSPGNLF
jgi:hypothetical protein